MFDDTSWDLYKTPDNVFYLLIPKEFNIYNISLKKDVKHSEYPGFKISDLSCLKPLDINGIKINSILNNIEINEDALTSLKNMFIPNSAAWSFFLMGHGGSSGELTTTLANELTHKSGKIAGISEHIFIKFINFLSKDISTNTLFYKSCFAGGKNLINPYQVRQGEYVEFKIYGIQDIYPFTIIAQATLNQPTIADGFPSPEQCSKFFLSNESIDNPNLPYVLFSETNEKKISKLPVALNFKAFFESLQIRYQNPPETNTPQDETSWVSILKYVTPFYKKAPDPQYLYWSGNCPLIRKINTSYFEVLPLDESIRVIPRAPKILFPESNNEDIELQNTRSLFLYPSIVNASIKIEGDEMPAIISPNPGASLLFLNKMEAPSFKFREIVDAFLKAKNQEKKVFIIKELTCKSLNETLINLTNVIINITDWSDNLSNPEPTYSLYYSLNDNYRKKQSNDGAWNNITREQFYADINTILSDIDTQYPGLHTKLIEDIKNRFGLI